ncbi:MAG: Kef family K(+) transporter [Actinobacteria bacterium HGW-Actinobacteria-4]|nr:MAG: Kef family K(+) transporter [Actinobacteria bacterium HGW-Actinobacteria-4]
MHAAPLLTLIAAGLVSAFALGLIARAFRLPPIVGYLIAGLLIGPYTPGYAGDVEVAGQLAEIGVILLMFGVGLHFNFRDLVAVGKIALPGAIAQMSAATAMGFGLGMFLNWDVGASLLFGLALSVASTVVLLRALEERQLIDTRAGHVAIGWLIVEDIAIVLALVIVPVLAASIDGVNASETGVTGDAGPAAIATALAWTIFKVAAFVALMFVVGRRIIPWLLARVAGTGSRELFTLGVLAIGLGVAVGAAYLFEISFALGAFFAGMILSESNLSRRAADDSLPLRDAFAVLFFVSVGMLLDPSVFIVKPLAVLATVFIIMVGKSLVAFVLIKAFRKSTTMAFIVAASLAQIGEFSFILMTLGLKLEILPETARDLVLAGAILSIMLNPLVFALAKRQQRIREEAEALVNGTAVIERTGDDFPFVYRDAGHVILVGYGRVGRRVAASLWEKEVPCVVVDVDEARVDFIRDEGHDAIFGNAARATVLKQAGIEKATHVLVAVPNGLEAGEVVAKARKLAPDVVILARTHQESEIDYLIERGANRAIWGEREIATIMVEEATGQEIDSSQDLPGDDEGPDDYDFIDHLRDAARGTGGWLKGRRGSGDD